MILDEVVVTPMGDGHAFVAARGTRIETRAGVRGRPYRMVLGVLWRREASGWRYLDFHESTSPIP